MANEGRAKVADQVAERVERLIVEGVLKVGQALPSERRLVEKLGCSRALHCVRAAGAARAGHHRHRARARLLVADSPGRRATPLMHLFSSQPRTLFDLLEVRALLEAESARLAALRATDVDRLLIRRRYEEMLAAHQAVEAIDAREHAHRDHAFHRAISEASHNPCWYIPCNR